MLHLLVLLELAALAAASNSAEQLNYHEQDHWGGTCTAETSKAQSPIDIKDCEIVTGAGNMVKHRKPITSLKMKNENNSNTLKYQVKGKTFSVPWIENRKVKLLQLHIHWGEEAGQGSEHLVDGTQYSAETHLVTQYTADDDSTKYMVFARLFKVDNEVLNEQIEQMIAASEEDKTRNLHEFNLSELYPTNPGSWYSYQGSLTTPGCDEIVHWVVVKDPLLISDSQLQRLRALQLGEGNMEPLSFNWRKTQETNGRECQLYEQ